MQEIIEGVEKLAYEELERANVKFGTFHSTHEGYAVIKEEIEEAADELEDIATYLSDMWRGVKGDSVGVTRNYALYIKQTAVRLAAESIQVAAMAQKFIDSSKQWKVADINE